jgi:hypothetical protein
MPTPDEEVSKRIIEEFRKTKLLSSKGLTKIDQKLAAGKITQEEWRLIFENELDTEEKDHASKS